jgi:hypothetical protein
MLLAVAQAIIFASAVALAEIPPIVIEVSFPLPILLSLSDFQKRIQIPL